MNGSIANREQEATIDALLRGERMLLDVRAPGEVARARAPWTVNLPILTDAERHRIGITYKQQGSAAAEKLGFRLVDGDLREERIKGWVKILQSQPDAVLSCWRGGLRSQIAARWLVDAGYPTQRLSGGYQALRRRSCSVLAAWPERKQLLLLGGRTGVGKTEVLTGLPATIDLEGLAVHRGSAFGQVAATQPTPATFENCLAGAALALNDHRRVLLEDESRTIGRLALPEGWFDAMRQAPIVLLEASIEERIAHIQREYVAEPLSHGQTPDELYRRYAQALLRIRKRLGGQRYQQALSALKAGFASGDHQSWIETLLRDYYDPSYDFQLQNKMTRVVFRGDAAAVQDFWRAQVDEHAER